MPNAARVRHRQHQQRLSTTQTRAGVLSHRLQGGQVGPLRAQAGFEVENLGGMQPPGPRLKLAAAHDRQRRGRKGQMKLAPLGLHAFVRLQGVPIFCTGPVNQRPGQCLWTGQALGNAVNGHLPVCLPVLHHRADLHEPQNQQQADHGNRNKFGFHIESFRF